MVNYGFLPRSKRRRENAYVSKGQMLMIALLPEYLIDESSLEEPFLLAFACIFDVLC